jgi:hypothetical protein
MGVKMNKSNRVKLIIAILLIIVVAIATISYGNSQRKKAANNDPTQSSLPTIRDSQKQNNNPSMPGESQPKPQNLSQSSGSSVPNPSVQQTVQPQIPQGRTPATGPEDHLLPIVVLGTMSGLYVASQRKLAVAKKF